MNSFRIPLCPPAWLKINCPQFPSTKNHPLSVSAKSKLFFDAALDRSFLVGLKRTEPSAWTSWEKLAAALSRASLCDCMASSFLYP